MILGTLERLQRFWLSGSCNYKSDEETKSKSIPLGIRNFTSAFVLLAMGMLFGALLLLLEHIYFKFLRVKLRKYDKCGCCGLISLVSIIVDTRTVRYMYMNVCIHAFILWSRSEYGQVADVRAVCARSH